MPTNHDVIRPFLKWAGSKTRIMDRLRHLLPGGKRLVEPFTGSGAVFLNTRYSRYLLTDSNRDLISLYQILKDEGATFIESCRPLFLAETNHSTKYYKFRKEFNAATDPWRRAQLFLYLNRHGYNGLCRYNSSGEFNVPFGSYTKTYFPEREMHLFHEKAAHAEFRHADFLEVMAKPKKGDVFYCDPPYVPLSLSANFTAYSAGGFDLERQQALADSARKLAGKGFSVLISNHDTQFTKEAYHGAQLHHFDVQRSISCNVTRRNKAGELLALFLPSETGQ